MAKQKVKVNGKELYTDSDEYKYLYNNNQLAAISDDPTIGFEKTAPTVEVIGEAPRWLKEKREREKYYDPNLTKEENEKKYQAKKTIQGWKSADINQPGGLERAGEVMSFPLKSAGAGVLFGGEVLNTIPALLGETVSGRFNYPAALPNPLRAMENAGITGMWDPNADQQKTTGQVFFPNNPYAAMAVDLPVDIATGKVLGTGAKMLGKIPKFGSKASKIDNVDDFDVSNLRTIENDETEEIARRVNELRNRNLLTRDIESNYNNFLNAEFAPRNMDVSTYMDFLNQNQNAYNLTQNLVLRDIYQRLPILNPANAFDLTDDALRQIENFNNSNVVRNPGFGGNTIGRYNYNSQQFNQLNEDLANYITTNPSPPPNYIDLNSAVNNKKKSFAKPIFDFANDINLKLGKMVNPLKDKPFDIAKLEDKINNELIKGQGIKKIDSPLQVKYENNKFKIFTKDVNDSNNLKETGYIDLRLGSKPKQYTFTESIGLNKPKDKDLIITKDLDFPYSLDDNLKETAIGAEVVSAMNKVIKNEKGKLHSSTYHLREGVERYLHDFLKNRVEKIQGFGRKQESILEELFQNVGTKKKKEDLVEYINSLPSQKKSDLYDAFRSVKWGYKSIIPGAIGTGAALNELQKQNQMEGETKYKMGGRVEGKSGMSTNPLSRLTNKNGAYGLHVEGRYGHVDGRYGHVDGRYGHVDGEKGMQVKYKKGGYLKDEDTYVTEDGKETRRGLWANVHLKNKREGKAEYGIRVINPYLWKKDYDKKHSYEEGGEIEEDDDYYNNDLVPVEIENSERVYMKKEDGSYHLMLETDKTAPRHEEGGVKLGLPEDSLVFPKQYFNELDDAMDEGNATGDWSMMDEVADKMLANAQKAYDEGKPYSSGGDSDRDLSKMRCGGCGSKMGMGGKCNRCGGGIKYGFGGALRRLYADGGAVAGKIGGAIGSAVGGLAGNTTEKEKKTADKETIKEVQPGKFTPDKSLPNLGYAKREQAILNELIAKDKGEALVLDDIIGEKTLGAMKKYEGKGYKRPVLFSDENLALYKKQWEEIVAKKKGSSESQAETETKKEEKKSANETVESEESADNEKIYDDIMTAIDIFGIYRDAKESKKKRSIETTKGMFKNWVKELPEKKTTEQILDKILPKTRGAIKKSKIDQTPMPGAESWTQSFANALGTGYPMDASKNQFSNLKNQGTPAEFLEKEGWIKVPSESVTVTDGDGVIINNKKYRLSDLQGGDAYFDAAESYAKSYSGKYFQQYYQDEKGNKVNTSKKALEEMVKNKPFIYIKDSGKKSHDRIIAGLMYGGDNDMYHSSDSAMVTRGEAVYGVDPDDKRMTERQKNITNRAKSEFKYKKYPDEIRTLLELPYFKTFDYLPKYVMPSDFSNKKKK